MDNPQSISTSNSPTVKLLADIWAAVLNREDVGIYDDFFDIGGDSLSAMMCVHRVRTTFGVEIEIHEFFLEPATVARVAGVIDALMKSQAERLHEG
jgi:acyl carrier protein